MRSTTEVILFHQYLVADLVSDPYGSAGRAAQNTCCHLGKMHQNKGKKKQLAILCLEAYS